MATCGYLCPLCEGTGYNDKNEPCHWCTSTTSKTNDISNEEWIKQVHEGPCCGDLGEK